jgi:two-component system, cell cycle response regulator
VQGKILILDAIATNRIVLKVKLASSFYKVMQATTIAEAVDQMRFQAPDLIISALSLPDGTAADLCARIKSLAAMQTIPVLGIGSRAQTGARMEALESGVQDVLIRPVDDTLLLGRIRSLIRAHSAATEWQMRDDTSRALGLAEPERAFQHDMNPQGEIIFATEDRATAQLWVRQLAPKLRNKLRVALPRDFLRMEARQDVLNVFVFVLPADPKAASATLQVISTLRANSGTRHSGVMILQTHPDPALATAALDLGADDVMTDGFEATELALRLKSMMRRKMMTEQMRATVRTGLKAAVFDPLTGLHNRRYAMPHLARIAEHAQQTNRPFAVMVADLDHFKTINDHYGHAAGDAVLIETAQRLRNNLRAMDMVARIGGEEFLIAMPNTTMAEARTAAARLCDEIGTQPFELPAPHAPIPVTISIGLTLGCLAGNLDGDDATNSEKLLAAADKALYSSKIGGRNQVTLSRPAA